MNDWNNIWKRYNRPNFALRIIRNHFYSELEKAICKIVKKNNISKQDSLIEVGSGSGRSLEMIRNIGFSKSIGVDSSKEAISSSSKNFGFTIGRDVILADVTNSKMGKNCRQILCFPVGLLNTSKIQKK